MGYRSLANSMRPIEPIIDHSLKPRNPVQDTTPITSHVMSIPNLPRSPTPEIQPSIHVLSVPSNAGGQPPARPTLSYTRIVPSQGHTSNIEPSTVYVPPTHTIVDPGGSRKVKFSKSSNLSKTSNRSKGSSRRFQQRSFHLKRTPYEKVIAFCSMRSTDKIGKRGATWHH